MPEDPTEDLQNRLWDVLEGDLDQIPPSERERFLNIKSELQKIEEEDSHKTYFLVENLSEPDSAFRIEQIFHHPGFVGANEQWTHWQDGNMYYYASLEIKKDLYRRLRRDRLEDQREYLAAGHVVKESPGHMIVSGFKLAWEEWFWRPLRTAWSTIWPF